jgi:threonine dehydrogenase-like Zn-dependent dehydrogenase
VVAPEELDRLVRARTGSMRLDNGQLGGGVAAVVDCVGSPESIAQGLRIAAPGSTILAVGMPGVTTVDLTPLWQREISLTGAYAYGTETLDGTRFRTFDLAAELVAAADLGRLVSATYPLDRFADALAHAGAAGRLGATKIAFCLPTGGEPDHPASRTLKGRR